MRRVSALALLFLSSLTPVLRAQSINASLTGRITDPSKALIVDAKVAAISTGTNFRYETTTNASGEYYLANLPPASYRIEVEKPGFQKLIKPDVILHIQDALAIDFEMAVGSASESITVEGGAPLVNSESATVSTVVDSRFVENIPLNGRSFQALLMLTPGVVLTATAFDDQGQFSVNGQRADANYFTVDGVSANFGVTGFPPLMQSAGGGLPAFSALGGTNSLVSVDAMRNFAFRRPRLLRNSDAHPVDRFQSQHAREQIPFMARSLSTSETVCWTPTTGFRILTICLSPRSDRMTLAA